MTATTATFTYGCVSRPPDFFNTPTQGRIDAHAHPDFPLFGVVVYDRPLTAEEIDRFNLRPIDAAAKAEGKRVLSPIQSELDDLHVRLRQAYRTLAGPSRTAAEQAASALETAIAALEVIYR
jgi:hypothetical protein